MNNTNTLTEFPITTHSQLLVRIAALKAVKIIQEEELKVTLKRSIASIDIISLLKGGNSNSEKEPLGFAKTGLNMILNLIIDIVVGKNRSVKGFLSAILIEKFTTSLINNTNLMSIVSVISSLISRKNQYDKSQDFNSQS